MQRTKIVATIGPSTANSKKLKRTGTAGIFSGALELAKDGNLIIKQNKLFDDIYIKKNGK